MAEPQQGGHQGDPAAGLARARELREVAAVNTAFYEAIETGDLDTMRDLWVDDADAVCVHPGAGPIRGTGRILRSWAMVMASTSYIQFFLTDVEVGLAPSTASVTCTENVLTGDERTGPDAFGGGRALATNVFLRTGAGWRLWIHHATPAPLAAPTAGADEGPTGFHPEVPGD